MLFDAGNDSEYLPHNYDKNCVVYTGTHDNDTTVGFIQNMPEKDKKFAKKYLGHKNDKKLCFEIVRAALSSCADTAVIPMQDYLELDSSAGDKHPTPPVLETGVGVWKNGLLIPCLRFLITK